MVTIKNARSNPRSIYSMFNNCTELDSRVELEERDESMPLKNYLQLIPGHPE